MKHAKVGVALLAQLAARSPKPQPVARPAQLPPELLGSVPRDVRLTSGGRVVAAFAAFVAAAAVPVTLIMILSYTSSRDARDLRRRDGVTTTGEVINVALRKGDKDEKPRRVVTYAYAADGRSFTGRVTLRQSDRSVTAERSPLSIGYLSSAPETSWVIGYERGVFPLVVIPLTLVTMLIVAGAVARTVSRQRTLLAEGRVAMARITGQKKIHGEKKRAYKVTCEFEVLSGARRTKRYQTSKTPPPIGSLVPIVYHRDNPDWSAAYPFDLVRTCREIAVSH